jgi:hypothetical protein
MRTKLGKQAKELTQQDVESQLRYWRGQQRMATNQDSLNEATEQLNSMLELWVALQPVAYG